jgi:GT2 family glycosyltransferase
MKISGYVPFYNNESTVLAAVDSLRNQNPPLDEVFAIDDGSTDKSVAVLEQNDVRVLRQPRNLGRGAARARAMCEASNELVLCCDATNVLPTDFACHASRWFDDASVGAVFGVITDPTPHGTIARWRARHLFKADGAYTVSHRTTLITFGTMVRASAIAAIGGFDTQLRHNEDNELGERLLCAGYDVVGDPSLKVVVNIKNTLPQVLERYWRWYVGKDEYFSYKAYLRSIWYSARSMALSDLKSGDPFAACISLCLPHYQLWRHFVK